MKLLQQKKEIRHMKSKNRNRQSLVLRQQLPPRGRRGYC